MKTNDYILSKYINILSEYYTKDVIDNLIGRWNEPHRFWHNMKHLLFLLRKIDEYFLLDENVNLYMTDTYKNFILAAFWHDAIYDPRATDNEEKCVIAFHNSWTNGDILFAENVKIVIGMIRCTKERKLPLDSMEKTFWMFDNDILFNGSNTDLIDYENKIFKEFQFVSYEIYKAKRIEFLKGAIDYFESINIDTNLAYLIPYIKNRKIKVGLYTGSFNPFHLGHLDVLQKASLIFDKVIVAYGNNPEKTARTVDVPTTLNTFQVDTYIGLVTDYIASVENDKVDVTLVRGLRNGDDLDYESNQLSFIQDIKPDVKVVYIPCDKKYEHISSTAIRNLEKFDKNLATKYLVK